jgi:hypothetical protein
VKPNPTKPVRKECFKNPQSETNPAKKQSVELFGMQASEQQGRLVVEGGVTP